MQMTHAMSEQDVSLGQGSILKSVLLGLGAGIICLLGAYLWLAPQRPGTMRDSTSARHGKEQKPVAAVRTAPTARMAKTPDTSIQDPAWLVLSGDSSVPKLQRILVSESKADDALAAGRALAQLATPKAARALIEALTTLPDGELKEEVARLAGGISEGKTANVFMDALQRSSDPVVLCASQYALAQMADWDVVHELATRCEVTDNSDQRALLLNAISLIKNSDAADALMDLSLQREGGVPTPLADSAVRALANIGNGPSASFLIQQLEAAPLEQSGRLYEAISNVSSPEGRAALLYAAQGNKEATTEQTRAAAILALANSPDEQTGQVLERLTHEDNEAISFTARTTLNQMQQVAFSP